MRLLEVVIHKHPIEFAENCVPTKAAVHQGRYAFPLFMTTKYTVCLLVQQHNGVSQVFWTTDKSAFLWPFISVYGNYGALAHNV